MALCYIKGFFVNLLGHIGFNKNALFGIFSTLIVEDARQLNPNYGVQLRCVWHTVDNIKTQIEGLHILIVASLNDRENHKVGNDDGYPYTNPVTYVDEVAVEVAISLFLTIKGWAM